MTNKNTKKSKNKILSSKKTTVILSSIILLPFLIFGFILIRDKMGTGTPVIGSRNDHQLEHKITEEQLKAVEELVKIDDVKSSKITLKASTLRVYLEVSAEMSKEQLAKVGEAIYKQVIEVIPIDPYFTNTENNKQYDLEVHTYNDVEDKTGDDFVYYEIIRTGSMEDTNYAFLTDAKDPEFKEEVLELMEKLAEEREAEKSAKEAEKEAEAETEEDEGGE